MLLNSKSKSKDLLEIVDGILLRLTGNGNKVQWECLDRDVLKIIPEKFPNISLEEVLNYRWYGGGTVLHSICYHDHCKEAVSHFLGYGADVTAQNSDGNTPLHCMFIFGRNTATPATLEIVKLLVEKSPEILATKNHEGYCPIDMVHILTLSSPNEIMFQEIEKYLSKSKCDPDPDPVVGEMSGLKV